MKTCWVVLFLCLWGCGREARTSTPQPNEANPPAPSPPGSTSPPPAPVSPPAATAAAPPDPCADIRSRFAAELAKRSDKCTTAADCRCYGAEGGGCGGVTDSATAERLAPISKEFHDAKCRYTAECAAWACAPKCQNGLCRR